jgi:glucokinase
VKPSTCAIGIDVGGTKCAAGLLVLPARERLAQRVQPTEPARGGRAVLDDVRQIAQSLCDEARHNEMDPVAIGIGVAELVNKQGQVVSESSIRWKDIAVADEIRAGTGIRTYIEADVRAAARAEATLGAGRGLDVFLYITIGTGISSCLVLGGVPYEGAAGLAGTFASSPILAPIESGELASTFPLEQYAAGPAIAARMRQCRVGFNGNARDVLALAETDDLQAQAIIMSAAAAVGAAIAHLVNVLDPVAVVLGGGLGLAGGQYGMSLEAGLRACVWSDQHRNLPLLDGNLGPDAGWIGAALFAANMPCSDP